MAFLHRFRTAIFAPPIQDPSQPSLRIGLVGGDIPIFPPFAMALLCLGGGAGWYFTGDAWRYLPRAIFPAAVRYGGSAFLLVTSGKAKKATDDALVAASTEANFKPVPSVADQGPFAVSRNPMYLSLAALPVVLSIALDSAWFVCATLALALYLDRIVVPAEERFLKKVLGKPYVDYCRRVPRWFFFSPFW